MLEKKTYANGQAVYSLSGGKLTYYFKSGIVKAEGRFADGPTEGEWLFSGDPASCGKPAIFCIAKSTAVGCG